MMMQDKEKIQSDRQSKGQFRLACSSCRNLQIPCDQAKPKCLNCIKRGIPCHGGVTVAPRKKVTFPRVSPPRRSIVQRAPYANAHEGRAFHFVASDLMPLVSSLVDEVFFHETILPAACQDKRLFYIILAWSSRFHNDTWAWESNHDKLALSWYNKSINESITKYNTSTDILLNIKCCGFYSQMENKYGDPEAGFKLRLTAYKIATSMKDKIEYSEDAISTLCWTADTAITGASGSGRIPYDQFKAINDLGLKMSKKSTHQLKYDLSFRLWQIMYDVDSLLLNQEPPSDLDDRIGAYEASLIVFDVKPKNILIYLRFRFLFGLARTQYESFRGEATEILRKLIKNLHLGSSIQNCRKLVLDSYIGPGLAFLRWHYKADDLDEDIADILATFDLPELQGSLKGWLLMLHIITDGDRPAMAQEVFGHRPRVLRLQHWLELLRLGGGIKTLKCIVPFLEAHPLDSSRFTKILRSRAESSPEKDKRD